MKENSILLIDSDQLVHSFLQEFAQEEDLDLTIVGSATEALSLLKEKDFKVIITEYKVGEINGVDFIKRVNLKKVNIPIVLLTDYSETRLIRDAWFSGAFDFLEKPVSKERLFESLFLALRFGSKELDRYKYSRQAKNFPEFGHRENYGDEAQIDLVILKNLFEILGNDIFSQVLEGFKIQTDSDLKTIEKIKENHDFEKVGLIYRRTGDAARSLGLINVFNFCGELELYSAVDDERCFEMNPLKKCIDQNIQFISKYVEENQKKSVKAS